MVNLCNCSICTIYGLAQQRDAYRQLAGELSLHTKAEIDWDAIDAEAERILEEELW